MRNLRKLMAVIVSVAMMVSLFVVPAFAEQTMTDVEVCELLNVLRGTGDGLSAEYLASKPQRYQAARLFLRLQGLEDDALAFEGTANFSDVEAMPDWQFATENKAVLAYLYANPELGFVGYTDGTFRPFNEISAMEYYKVLLTALGYEQNVDYVYGDDLLDFAAGLGLSEVADVEDFSIMHLATATVEALKAVVKDEEVTLIEKLVADGVIEEEDAIATGIYEEVAPEFLAVESITATNLAELYVKFNQPVDKATVKADYFKVQSTKVAAAALQADNVTVKLTVDKAKIGGNGVNYKVEITKDVKSAAGIALEKAYSGYYRVIDNELPYITGMTLTGPRTIEITYSEPIEVKPTVKINKGVFGCSVGDINTVTNKVIVTIAATKLPEGDYTIAITDAEDYAGFKMDADEKTLAYAADNSPITAEVTEATQSTVKVKFNKRVTLGDTATSYFYHTFSSHRPIEVTTSDNMTYTLRFVKNSSDPAGTVEYPIPAGTTQLVVNYKGANNTKIEDEWGNKLENNIVLSITVSADETAPTIVGDVEVVNSKTIKIYFNEALDKDTVEDEDNYTVEEADGDKVTDFTATYDTSSSKYAAKLTFTSDLSGNYTVTVKGIKDASVKKNEIAQSVPLSFFVDDMAPPSLAAIQATVIDKTGSSDKDIIYVTFPEQMITEGKYSVLDASNYLLAGAALPKDTTLEAFGNTGKVVKITLPDASIDFKLSQAQANWLKLTVARVSDIAGNVSPQLSYDVTIIKEAAPAVTKIEQTASNKMTLTVNKPLLSVLPDALKITVGSSVYYPAGVDSWAISSDGKSTTVNVTLTAALVDVLKDIASTYGSDTSLLVDDVTGVSLSIVGQHIVSEAGQTAEDAAAPAVSDKWAASFKKLTVSAATYQVTVEFTEALDDAEEALYAQDLVIKDLDGKLLVAGSTKDYTTIVDGTGKLVITFVKQPANLAGSGSKYYTIASKDTITYIQGTDNNKIATFTAQNVKNPN